MREHLRNGLITIMIAIGLLFAAEATGLIDTDMTWNVVHYLAIDL
jgi:hypothetical protein